MDTALNAIEGFILLACAVHLCNRAKNYWDWTFCVLFAFQGFNSLLWAAWRNDPIVKLMNDFVPQYLEIAAFAWLAFMCHAKKTAE